MRIEQPPLLAAMNHIERAVDVERDPFGDLPERIAKRSIMAQPMRSKARASGRFSRREMVDCEHSARSDGDRSSAILNRGSYRRPVALLPSSYPAPIISRRKRMNVGKAMGDVIRRARVFNAGSQTISDAKPLLNLAQHQKPTVRRYLTTDELGDNKLASDG